MENKNKTVNTNATNDTVGKVKLNGRKVNFNTSAADDYLTNEAYKSLRTNLLFCGNDIKSVLITSTVENEGKSIVSSELVKSLSDLGKKTLLIDADMRKSVMLKDSQRSAEVLGLSEALSGFAAVEDIVYNTQHENFDVVFSGHFPPNPVELLENGRFKDILNTFKQTYDYIIIDSPPLGVVIDAAVIAAYCDGAIMVFAERHASRKAALDAKIQLEKSGCRILGGVMNEADPHNTKYYKKYYKYRNYKYNKYYR